jgi:hypothetical protein
VQDVRQDPWLLKHAQARSLSFGVTTTFLTVTYELRRPNVDLANALILSRGCLKDSAASAKTSGERS